MEEDEDYFTTSERLGTRPARADETCCALVAVLGLWPFRSKKRRHVSWTSMQRSSSGHASRKQQPFQRKQCSAHTGPRHPRDSRVDSASGKTTEDVRQTQSQANSSITIVSGLGPGPGFRFFFRASRGLLRHEQTKTATQGAGCYTRGLPWRLGTLQKCQNGAYNADLDQ